MKKLLCINVLSILNKHQVFLSKGITINLYLQKINKN